MSFKAAALAESLIALAEFCVPLAGPVARLGHEAAKVALRPSIDGWPVPKDRWQGYVRYNDDIDVWRLPLELVEQRETPGMQAVLREGTFRAWLADGVDALHVIDVTGKPSEWCYVLKGWTLQRHKVPGDKVVDIPDPVMRQTGLDAYETTIVWGEPTYWFVRQQELGYRRLVIPVLDGESHDVVGLIVACSIESPRGWSRLYQLCGPARRLVSRNVR